MEDELIHVIASELITAEENKQSIERFTKHRYPDLSVEQAYHIQEALIQIKRMEGDTVVAPKMGLTSKAKWDQMGVDKPIYGYIFDSMRVEGDIEFANYIHPKIEPEIGIVLASDMQGPGVTKEDVLQNIKYVFSAVEVIDSRYTDFDFHLGDVIADNASSKGYIFSKEQISLDKIDLANETVQVTINDEIVAEGIGSNVLDHPAESIAALVNMLGANGQKVKKGEPIMTGGMTSAVLIEPGDVIKVTYSTLPTIEVTVK